MGGVARISPPMGIQMGLVMAAMKMSTGLKKISRPPPMKRTGRPITTAANNAKIESQRKLRRSDTQPLYGEVVLQ